MKPGAIECAFTGICGREPTRRTSERTGRDWASFSVAVGEEPDTQWLDVACFGPMVDTAVALVKGDRLYVEGRISLRSWQNNDGTSRTMLSVAANLVQPMGKIGQQRPKRTRAKPPADKPKTDYHAPLPFDDELPI
jgi:single-stranded DNA-binding protein